MNTTIRNQARDLINQAVRAIPAQIELGDVKISRRQLLIAIGFAVGATLAYTINQLSPKVKSAELVTKDNFEKLLFEGANG